MPTLLIFDDDKLKCELAKEVANALAKAPTPWSLGFANALENARYFTQFVAALDQYSEPLVLLDIEIKKPSRGKDWRKAAAAAVSKKVAKGTSRSFQFEIARLESHFGSHADYQVSLPLLAYLLEKGVPVVTISTKGNTKNASAGNSECAVQAGLKTLYWNENWKNAWTSQKLRKENCTNLASAILEQWMKLKGTIIQRLWPKDAAKWFHRDSPQPDFIRHSWETNLATNDSYLNTMATFLAAISKIPISSYCSKASRDANVLERRHDALKCIVGACAKAYSDRDGGRVPNLNSVALLAAAWDPDAATWFPSFGWEAERQMVTEKANKAHLKKLILAIGGEDGLFAHLLREKPDTSKSTLVRCDSTRDSLSFILKFPLNKDSRGGEDGIEQQFRKAKKNGKMAGIGDTTKRLVGVWKQLEVSGKKLIDIEVTGRAITFKKA